MKTVKLTADMEYLGRLRRQGEVVVVPDSSNIGVTITRDIEKKNKQKLKQFRDREQDEDSQGDDEQ